MSILNSSRTVNGPEELKKFWEEFLPHVPERTILLLNGDIGAGKTTSVQFIAELLNLKNIQSPSFAIHLRYENSAGRSLDHIDLYRLKDDDDLESSGFWDIFDQRKGLVVIEWSQRLNIDYLPLNWNRFEVKIEKTLIDTQRIVSVRVL